MSSAPKYSEKRSLRYLLLLVIPSAISLICCEPKKDFIYGRPGEGMLRGTWILEKVVTPSKTMVGMQIGFETLKFENINGSKTDQTYRNDLLVESHIWAKTPGPVVDGPEKTIIRSYSDGLKRFHKITVDVGKPTILEVSQYLKEFGSAADTITYYYSQDWW